MPCPNSARKRSKTMAFRVSPEEYEQITNLAKLSGMDKQDFIMAKLMDLVSYVRENRHIKDVNRYLLASMDIWFSDWLERYERIDQEEGQ